MSQYVAGTIGSSMSNEIVYLKNTVSGVVTEHTSAQAKRYLAHAIFGRNLIQVNSKKNEVLAQPYTIEDGERKPIATASPNKKEGK